MVEKRDIIAALSHVRLSGCDRGALAQGLVQDVLVAGDRVQVILFDRIGGAPVPAAWVEALQRAVAAVPGVKEAAVEPSTCRRAVSSLCPRPVVRHLAARPGTPQRMI